MLKRVWSIVVAVALLLTMACFAFAVNPTALVVTVNDADLRPGDEVTATIQLNNYADNWSAMSIVLTYDANLLDLKTGELASSVRFGNFAAGAITEIFEASPGNLKLAWMDTDNVVFDEEAAPLVEIDLVAKGGVTGSAAVTAQFVADGQLSTDAETGIPTEIIAGIDTFSAEVASSAPVVVDGVAWEQQPVIRMELEKDRVQLNRTVDATVYIDKYIPWNQLSVDFGLNDCLEIVGVEPIGFTGDVAWEGGNVTVTAAGNVSGEGFLTDGALRAMKVTFKGTQIHEAFDFTAAFAEGGQKNDATGALKGDVHYSAAAASASLTVAPDKTDLEVVIDAPENLRAGQEFDVYVKLKEHENEWAAFTLVGTYDPETFQVVDIDTETYDYGYTVVEPEALTDKLEVVWVNTENIKIDDSNPTVMKIRFKALQATAADAITFAFRKDGVIAEDESGNLGKLESGTDFTDEAVGGDVTVAPTPMYLTYKIEGELTEIKASKTFSVIVSVNDSYEKLAALSIKGTYDRNQFDLVAVEPILKEFGDTGSVVTPDVDAVNAGEEELEIVWIGAENVALEPSFEAVRLTFMAKEQAEAAAISFNFIDGGVLRMGADGLPEKLAADTYFKTEAVTATIKITAPKVLLDVRTDAENVAAGDEFTVEVYVVDYYSPLAGFSVEGVLDPEKFEVLEYSAETVGGVAPTIDDEELEFVWFSADNIVTGQQEFKIITLRVKALGSTTEEDAITFGYIPGGMVRVDGSGMPQPLVSGTDYAEEPEALVVLVAKKPVELTVSSDVSTVEAGKTFDVTVCLSEFYEGDWSSLGIWADFDGSAFAIEDAISTGGFNGTFAWTTENENGKPFVAGWVAMENQALTDSAVLTVTFLALADAEINDALERIDFYFASDATYTCVDADALDYRQVAADGTAYALEPAVFQINIIAPDTVIEVTIAWGDMKFTYDYGEWNVATHVWDNAGWTCEEGANEITVENTGAVGVTAGFVFEESEGMTGLTGAFDKNDFAVPVGGPKETALFTLGGKTEDVWETEQTVGVITITITADGVEEEVTP